MKIKNNVLLGFSLMTLALSLGTQPLRAQWNQNSSVGPYTYTDPANWVNGVVTNIFSTPPFSGLTLQFPGDFILTNGVLMNFPGPSNVVFQSDSATLRTLHISLGGFLRTNNNGGTITIGTVANPLALDLYGSSRTIGGGIALSTSSSLICTMNIYAQIVDSSGGTNGINVSGGNIYSYLLNTNSSFKGPVAFASLRGGGFANIKPIGGGPSALGAPLDSTNGTITVADGSSFGALKYLGSGDFSDRPFVWNVGFSNLIQNAYQFVNAGSGLLELAGQWTFPTNKTTYSQFIVNASTAPIQLDGYIKGIGNANGTFTYLLFEGGGTGVNATNRITLTGTTNDFKDFEVLNSVLAYKNTAPPGTPSGLGMATNVILAGGTGGSGGWVGNAGQGSSLQYFGPSGAIFTKNLQLLVGTSTANYYWALDNAGTNTTLIWSNNIIWNNPGAETGFNPRYLFINSSTTSTNVVLSQIPDANISVSGSTIGTIVATANPVGQVVNNGGVVQLLNPTNTFAGGVQVAYARTLQAMTLADVGQPSSIGTALYLSTVGGVQLTGINLGSTDSQRGGTFSYIGTNNASSDQTITVLGSTGTLCGGTIRNDSPNNSSLHLTYTGPWNLDSVMPKCLMTLGGSAQAVNTLDNILPDVNGAGNSGSLLVNGSSWRLTAAETLTATTTVANATLILDGSLAAGAGLNVDSGGFLTGTGTVYEAVSVAPGGTIGAGDGGIGMLSINGTLTNSGAIYLKLNAAAGTNDQLVLSGGSLGYGGNLTVTNLGGTLALSNTYTLFVAGSYSGSFTSSNLPPLSSGLAWDLSNLANNGSIQIVPGVVSSTPPAITGTTLVGSNLIFSGTNGSAGSQFYVLTSTNLTLPMTNWSYLSTNQFDVNGDFSVTNPVNLGVPANFFRIRLP